MLCRYWNEDAPIGVFLLFFIQNFAVEGRDKNAKQLAFVQNYVTIVGAVRSYFAEGVYSTSLKFAFTKAASLGNSGTSE